MSEYATTLASITPEQIGAMTPKEAGRKLDALTDAYQQSLCIDGSKTAQGRLHTFMEDPGVYERLQRGDRETMAEFHRLTAAVAEGTGEDRLAELIATGRTTVFDGGAGEVVTGQELSSDKLFSAVDGLRAALLPDGAVAEAFTGKHVSGRDWTAEERALARSQRAARMADPDWTRRLFAGGLLEQKELTSLNIIIASGA